MMSAELGTEGHFALYSGDWPLGSLTHHVGLRKFDRVRKLDRVLQQDERTDGKGV